MAYFVILPLFAIWLVLAASVTAASHFISQLRGAFPYVWRVAAWSSVGLLTANIVLILAAALGLLAADALPHSAGQIVTQLCGLMLLIGPVIVSAGGWLLGVAIGFILAARRRRVVPPKSSAIL